MRDTNGPRAARRAGYVLIAGGALFALLVGCSTSVDGVEDGDLGTARQALYNGDICDIKPDDPSCLTYNPPPSDPPTVSGTPTINTTSWTLSYAGWQLQVGALVPAGDGSSTLTSDDHLRGTMTMTRTSAATTTSLGYGAAIVRRIPRPGGTIDTACTKNADCYAYGTEKPRVFDTGDGDGPYKGMNYCVAVGTSTTKTCWQRPGPYLGPFQSDTSASWQNVRIPNKNETAWSGTGSRGFNIPHQNGAPLGTVETIPAGATRQYSVLAEINLQGTVYDASGNALGAPCSLYNVNSEHGIPYEEDPAYCARMLRPAQTFNPWKCGDATCNGTESYSSCPGDCPARCGDGICNGSETSSSCSQDCCPPYCASKPWLSGCDSPACL